MSGFVTREYKKGDIFYSESEDVLFGKDTFLGGLFYDLGLTSKYKKTSMKCVLEEYEENFIISTFYEDLLKSKREDELFIACLYKDKIVGILKYELDINCTYVNKCYDLIILNPLLCYEKSIMKVKDVERFIKNSLELVEDFYKPYYVKAKKMNMIIRDIQMYICLTRDQVPYFNSTINRIYKNVGFDDKQRFGYMYYTFDDIEVDKTLSIHRRSKSKSRTLAISRHRSKSRSRSKSISRS